MSAAKIRTVPSPRRLILLWDSVERIIRDPEEEEESTHTEEHANRIRSQYNQLLNNLTSVPDIVAQMYESHKLSDKEREHLQQFHSTPIRASEELLNIIIGKSPDVYQCFLESLQKTRQHHVYQMLSTDQQTETTDEQHVSEHSCLIHKNYCWLTETLDPDCGLLPLLFQREVLNRREYEQIRCFHDSYKKNETLLSIISRKTSDNFKEFQNALIETLQSHIVDKLTVTVGRVSENARRARDILDTPIRPILLPEPLLELEAYQPEPNQVRGVEENSPVVMETQMAPKPFSTKLTLYLQEQFSKLENEQQREVSIKVVVIREKTMSHSIWKMCIRNLLQELQNTSLMTAQTRAASEKMGKEIENQFSIQLMDTPEKRGLAKDKINRFQHNENDSEKAEERISQSQNQLLLLEPEKAMKLEMQMRAERYLQSEGDPVEQLIQLGASAENTQGKLVETEENIHERKLTLNQTDSDKPLMSPYDFEGIGSEEKLQSKYSTESVLIRTITTTAAKEEHKPIRGLTILDDELFVLSGESSAIEVFHSLKLTFSRRWERKELSDPWDIASCERTKRLYIMDYKSRDQSKAILVVNSNGKLLAKVKTGLDFGRLSITEQSNIIITVFLKNKLIVYSPDGQLLNEVELSSQAGIVHPRHAIRLTNGDFVVSHGYLDYDLHGVCIVSADGALKKFYGGMSGSGIGELNIPNYLAVDKDGFVLVVDRSNNRVILLNPDLKFEKEILSRTEHSLRHTTRMFLD